MFLPASSPLWYYCFANVLYACDCARAQNPWLISKIWINIGTNLKHLAFRRKSVKKIGTSKMVASYEDEPRGPLRRRLPRWWTLTIRRECSIAGHFSSTLFIMHKRSCLRCYGFTFNIEWKSVFARVFPQPRPQYFFRVQNGGRWSPSWLARYPCITLDIRGSFFLVCFNEKEFSGSIVMKNYYCQRLLQIR